MSAPQQSYAPPTHDVPAPRMGPVATRVRLDHIHPCSSCGAPRRLVLQNTPDTSRLGVSEWHVVRTECAGECCVGTTKPCPTDLA